MVMSSKKIAAPLMWLCFVAFYVFSNISQAVTKNSALSFLLVVGFPPLGTFVASVFSHGRKMRVRLSVTFVYLLILTLFSYVSAIWAVRPLYAVQKGNLLLLTFFIFATFDIFLPKENRVKFLLEVIMWSGYIVVAFALWRYGWSYITRVLSQNARVENTVLNANVLGLNAAFSILICVFLIFDEGPTFKNILAVGLAGLSLIALGASGSRKALFVVLIGVSMFGLIKSGSNKKHLLTALISVVLSLTFLVLLFVFLSHLEILQGPIKRVYSMFAALSNQGGGDASSIARFRLIQIGVELFKTHPILGVGMDNACLFTGYGRYFYLHNNFIEMLADGGVVGFFVYYWIYIYLFVIYWKNRDFQWNEFTYCSILMVVNLIMDYGMVTYETKTTYVYVLAFVALSEEIRRKKASHGGVSHFHRTIANIF